MVTAPTLLLPPKLDQPANAPGETDPLDPTTFSSATSSRPRMLDTSEVAISGRPVPAVTFVSPMTRLESPNNRPISTAPVTIALAPPVKSPTPAIYLESPEASWPRTRLTTYAVSAGSSPGRSRTAG